MARYLLQTGVDRFKGSPGGATFQKCGQVFGIRKRAVPVQKRTPAQSRVKNQFDFVQKRWKDLSPGEQASFAGETGNFTRTDSLGNSYELRADQLQSSTNLNMVARSEPVIDTMVSPVSYPSQAQNTIAIRPAIVTADIIADPVIVPADFVLTKFASATLAPGTAQPSIATMKLLSTFASGSNSLINDYDNYLRIWGDPSNKIGSQVWIAFVMTSTLNGQSNDPFFDFGFIEP